MKITNTYDLTGDYGICHINRGKDIIFDKEDYPILNNYVWSYDLRGDGTPMIRTHWRDDEGKKHSKFLTVALGYNGRVSTKNGNILDVRKDNLEMRTNTQIRFSCKRGKNNTTGIKGVQYDKRRNKYVVQINYRGEAYRLGAYDTLIEAARARTIAGDKIFCHGYVNSEQKALAEIFNDQ